MPDAPDAPQPPPQWDGSQGAPPGQPQWLPPQQGYPPQGSQYGYSPVSQGYPAVAPGNGLGITGGVCGIVAVALCWIPFVDYISIVLGALAIIFGAIGVRHANEHGGGGKGMAVTGIVTGIVAVVITILFLAVVYAAVTSIQVGAGAVGS